MKHCAIDMPSYTFAMKGQKILKARGYSCEIKRKNVSDDGCGYYISLENDCGKARDIFEKYSVPFDRIRNEVDRE